ncbi:tyrosine-type recombinase/integrase [Nocardioides panzhihuensis]|uniref:Integrase n=1 Tax=Nocardioides panzhihuensis TaxID=860243 RepID=A0A7Z0IQ57_9ACTN|nr:site-specific integrase [Nocardioides panzhihuensis]NYI75486.1 integrase [Nocardioides panzhihuensis]
MAYRSRSHSVPEKRAFGSIEPRVRKDGSKAYRARYRSPHTGAFVSAPRTFSARIDAEAWLVEEKKRTEDVATWRPPKVRLEEALRAPVAEEVPTFGEYVEVYLANRRVRGCPLESSTIRVHRSYLKTHILPTFAKVPLDAITLQMADKWYDALDPTKIKTRRECYSLARSIMKVATSARGPIPGRPNPFDIRGAGSGTSPKRDRIASGEELKIILATIREDWRAMVLLATWAGLRFGELCELRGYDVDLDAGKIRIRRAVSKDEHGKPYVKGPKSEAGADDVRIPKSVVPAIRDHLDTHVADPDDLVFPSTGGVHLDQKTFKTAIAGWYDARDAAKADDLRFHDLRATGATLLAQAGATEAEVMMFLRDSTPSAAQRYVRATQSRMDKLTDRLSKVAKASKW